MRVLHILNELRPSGAEVMLELAAPVWLRLGCELHLLALADTPGPQAERLTAAGWSVTNVSRSSGTLKLIASVKAAILRIRPDVVHLHQEGQSLPLCFAVWQTGVPKCRTVHNNFPFTGQLRLRKALERWLCRRLGSKHLSISTSVQATELKRFHNPTDLCWNWFDETRFRPPTPEERTTARERLGIPADQKVLITVGNASDVKNCRVVIEALSALKNPALHFYQIGNPHPEGTDVKIASQSGVAGQFHPMGPRQDVSDWLWACDLYLMPSIFEGFSLAAVEAIASGSECILADSPGLADHRNLNIESTWVPPTADAFQKAINAAILNPTNQAQLIINSNVIRSLLSVEPRATTYFEVWKSLIHPASR